MKYVLLIQNVAHEIIPEYDTMFPGIPISQRYSKSFLQQCVIVDDSTEVAPGDIYNPETQEFTTPVVEIPEEIITEETQEETDVQSS